MRISPRLKTTTATTWNWRTRIVRKNILQASLLLMFVPFLTARAGAQSAQETAAPSTNTGSSLAAPTGQQDMRDEMKPLGAEVGDEQNMVTSAAAAAVLLSDAGAPDPQGSQPAAGGQSAVTNSDYTLKGNFFQRMGQFYRQDWAGTNPAGPSVAKRG